MNLNSTPQNANLIISRAIYSKARILSVNRFICSAIILTLLFLSGCSTLTNKNNNQDKSTKTYLSSAERTHSLKQISQWQVLGKIAFIDKKERSSANISWKVDKNSATQKLNLTSYLGINVLQLTSKNNLHAITFDGKTYYDNDLQALIYSLTGFTLPIVALDSWMKGLPHQKSDVINYNETTQLPTSLISTYNQSLWQVTYTKYKKFNQHYLATKLSVKKDDLVIKLSINQWKLID
jgi:outer membrane lipoprotein LolB